MLSLILAESSLELVPTELQNHPSVLAHSQKIEKDPSEILLDNSWHFAAMKNLEDEIKRGRPDLIHTSLLSICGSPLYLEKKISVYVHTISNSVIVLRNQVRIPKSYHRFAGLMEQLFQEKEIISDGNILLELKNMNFEDLINSISPSEVVGLSTSGKDDSFQNTAKNLKKDACIVVGGFQKGHFSDRIKNKLDKILSVNKKSLELHVVTSRILYEYEKTIFM